MRSTRRRIAPVLRVALGTVVGGVALVGCSRSASPPPSTVAGTTTTAAAPGTTTPQSSTTTSAPAPTCSTALLSASVTPGGSAAGTTYATVTLTNNGPSPCSLDGYATVAFFGPSGAGGAGAGPKLPVTTEDGGPSPTRVTVASKATATFLFLYSDVPAGGVGCVTAASLTVTPPGSAESLSVPASLSVCGGSVRLYPVATPGSESP